MHLAEVSKIVTQVSCYENFYDSFIFLASFPKKPASWLPFKVIKLMEKELDSTVRLHGLRSTGSLVMRMRERTIENAILSFITAAHEVHCSLCIAA